mmetsp:Transcript_45437/g.105395  ORF Transcript_45437/g.105395 Transcript_45437/m.105395 type:complete len:239 (-) Transcript_45437:110-826(-)
MYPILHRSCNIVAKFVFLGFKISGTFSSIKSGATCTLRYSINALYVLPVLPTLSCKQSLASVERAMFKGESVLQEKPAVTNWGPARFDPVLLLGIGHEVPCFLHDALNCFMSLMSTYRHSGLCAVKRKSCFAASSSQQNRFSTAIFASTTRATASVQQNATSVPEHMDAYFKTPLLDMDSSTSLIRFFADPTSPTNSLSIWAVASCIRPSSASTPSFESFAWCAGAVSTPLVSFAEAA